MKSLVSVLVLLAGVQVMAQQHKGAPAPTTPPPAAAQQAPAATPATAVKKWTEVEARKACTTEKAADMTKCISDKMSSAKTN